ncbi:MAG TPA: glycosyltransferase [Acidimicrobiales bacterium]|nr:glycosyltransferase [Acidimicrobiales bacterium]
MDASDRGGIARYTRSLRRALEGQHATVAVAAPPGVGDAGLVLRGLRWGSDVARMSRGRLYALRLREVGPCASTFVRAVRRARPCVVHVQTEIVPGIDAQVLARLARTVPVVLTVHDPMPLEGGLRALSGQVRRWRAVDALIVHSTEARFLVEQSAPGVPVHVVRIDADFFAPVARPAVGRSQARATLGLPPAGVPVALLIGQIRPYKGVGLLARAWPTVAAAVGGARLFVVGEAYDGAELSALERATGVEVRRGFVSDADMGLWAAAADVLVLPYALGSHSGVLHLGLAAGTPVLASPPLAEEVFHTGAGAVVPLDHRAWAEALVGALGERPLTPPGAGPAASGSRPGHEIPAQEGPSPEGPGQAGPGGDGGPPAPGTAQRTLAVYRAVLERRRRQARGSPGDPSGGPS